MVSTNIRQAYEALEKRLAPRLDELVRTGAYAELNAIFAETSATIAAAVDGAAARVLHTVNLPADTDVRQLRHQIGALDREVRQLRLELAASGEHRGR